MDFKAKIAHLRSTTIVGKTIDLVPYGMEYVDDIIRLRNQADAKYFLSQDYDVSREQQIEWIKGYEERDEEFGFMVRNKSGAIVGINFCYGYDGESMELGRTTFDTERIVGKPYAIEAGVLFADIVFNYLDLPVWKTTTKADNHRLLKWHKRMNWRTTGTCIIRDNLYEKLELQRADDIYEKTFSTIVEARQNRIPQ
jgi:RimJ/RimL family protein N-acetyltransferase